MVGSHFDSMCRKNKEGVGVPGLVRTRTTQEGPEVGTEVREDRGPPGGRGEGALSLLLFLLQILLPPASPIG